MGKFTVIPQNTFEGLQMDAGVLIKDFDPEEPATPTDENIICATTGGINVVCQPEFSGGIFNQILTRGGPYYA